MLLRKLHGVTHDILEIIRILTAEVSLSFTAVAAVDMHGHIEVVRNSTRLPEQILANLLCGFGMQGSLPFASAFFRRQFFVFPPGFLHFFASPWLDIQAG